MTSCVTIQRLEYAVSASAGSFSLTFPEPVSLQAPNGSSSGLRLDVQLWFEVVAVPSGAAPGRWRPLARMYEYRLLDRDDTELLVYHWQPGPYFAGPNHPHLHCSASLLARTRANAPKQTIDLDKLHIPTGAVSFAVFVRGLIQEFRIAPRRDDWRRRLDETDDWLLSTF